jgi:hypothetical protein
MVLVIVGDIAVLSLVTIMLLFAKGNLRTLAYNGTAVLTLGVPTPRSS